VGPWFPDTQMPASKPPPRGVHLSTPSSEYLELQHPLLHCELDEQNSHSPRSGFDTQVVASKPPPRGVHLSMLSSEYLELQHPLLHCELNEQNSQSPSWLWTVWGARKRRRNGVIIRRRYDTGAMIAMEGVVVCAGFRSL
jgi:hypothetical protein